MTDDILYNATGFELLFFLSALLGAWFSRKNFAEAWADFRALGGISNGRRAVAIGTIVVETILLSIHAFYIIASLIAITTPGTGRPPTAVGILLQSILVYASWGMTGISFTTRRVRQYLNLHGLQARDKNGRFVTTHDSAGNDVSEE